MPNPRQTSRDEARKELLVEGVRSYADAFTALLEFQREVQNKCRAVLRAGIDRYAAALGVQLDSREIVDEAWPPPEEWDIGGYAADQERIVVFLEQNAHDTLRVPYRENRAVLFESRLFHKSDAPEFAPGYKNHRINLTFLYGRHGAPQRQA